MDTLHLDVRSGKHGTAPDHITYIARDGRYRSREDLLDFGFGNMPTWAAHDPNILFKASDRFERKNGSTYRAYTISLPNVLSDEQNIELSCHVTDVIVGDKPYIRAVHKNISLLSGELNPHVHVVVCERKPDGIERAAEQMFRRYNAARPELGGCPKDGGGLHPGELRMCLIDLRAAVTHTINHALEKYGHELRIDHRSFRERGINREPERYLGQARTRMMSAEDRAKFQAERARRRGRPLNSPSAGSVPLCPIEAQL